MREAGCCSSSPFVTPMTALTGFTAASPTSLRHTDGPGIVDDRGAHPARLEGRGELVDVRRAAQLDTPRAGSCDRDVRFH
jgi:hypothetical protein